MPDPVDPDPVDPDPVEPDPVDPGPVAEVDLAAARSAEAELRNKVAQAVYYETQTQQLMPPQSVRAWFERFLINPVALASLTSAVVALLSVIIAGLAVNATRLTAEINRRNNEEQHLATALARIGDKDSALTRASAAGMLGRIAARRETDKDTFLVIRDQLNHALRSETDDVVMGAITDAFLKLMDRDPDATFEVLGYSNRFLQQRLVDAIVDYLVSREVTDPMSVSPKEWQEIGQITRLSSAALQHMVEPTRLGDRYSTAWARAKAIESKSTEEERTRALRELKLNALRLQQSIQLCRRLFVGDSQGSDEAKSLWDGLFLAGADLSEADLSGTNLKYAELDGARLWHATIDDSTELDGADWWRADFFSEDHSEIDKQLLTKLFKRAGNKVPSQPHVVHESVDQFRKKQTE